MKAIITVEVLSQKITVPVALPQAWSSMTPAEKRRWLEAEEEQVRDKINISSEVTT